MSRFHFPQASLLFRRQKGFNLVVGRDENVAHSPGRLGALGFQLQRGAVDNRADLLPLRGRELQLMLEMAAQV